MNNMTTVDDVLRYGKKIIVAYTSLDGYEKAQIVEAHWLKEIVRTKMRKFRFMKSFPFFSFVDVEYTDVMLNAGTDTFPKWIHLYAQESPRLMAKKFGVDYPDVSVSRIEDDLIGK